MWWCFTSLTWVKPSWHSEARCIDCNIINCITHITGWGALAVYDPQHNHEVHAHTKCVYPPCFLLLSVWTCSKRFDGVSKGCVILIWERPGGRRFDNIIITQITPIYLLYISLRGLTGGAVNATRWIKYCCIPATFPMTQPNKNRFPSVCPLMLIIALPPHWSLIPQVTATFPAHIFIMSSVSLV